MPLFSYLHCVRREALDQLLVRSMSVFTSRQKGGGQAGEGKGVLLEVEGICVEEDLRGDHKEATRLITDYSMWTEGAVWLLGP